MVAAIVMIEGKADAGDQVSGTLLYGRKMRPSSKRSLQSVVFELLNAR
jgi:hypothetical protein